MRRDLAVRRVGAEANGLADVPGGRVQEIDRHLGLGRVRASHRDPAADGEARLGMGEHLRHVLDRLRRHAGGPGRLLEVHARHGVAESLVRHALVDHHTRMASASRPSVPGTLRTHSSAFDAVKDWRGST
jgi:hypothetical protein